jgi:uncharacterized lipoprotein NlpE involved in copper resistance
MNPTISRASLLLAALLLAACQPAPDAGPDPARAPAGDGPTSTAAAGIDADLVTDETSPAAGSPDFDVRAFAGRFAGTLPCADCPGIDSSLELRADGRYSQHDSYRERDAGFDASGTWTVEENGTRLRLDPDDKNGEDRLYGIVSNDELQMLDADGQPPDSGLDHSLRRTGAAQ